MNRLDSDPGTRGLLFSVSPFEGQIIALDVNS